MPEERDQYYAELKDATLEVVERGQFAQVFCLRKYPDRSLMSTHLIFTPFCVIITGDNRVENHGVQALGYGLDWFRRAHDPDYLAGKFLETRWVPEMAKKHWEEVLDSWRRRREAWLAEVAKMKAELPEDEQCDFEDPQPDEAELQPRNWHVGRIELEKATIVDALETLFEDCEDSFASPGELWNILPAYQQDPSRSSYLCPFTTEDMYGYGFPEHKVGWLSAIQRRFSELYAQMESALKVAYEKSSV